MDRAPLKDLDSLDREALLALMRTQQEQHALLIAAQDEEIRRLEAELESHRQTLSEQADELRSSSARIEHLKLLVEKLWHRMFGNKSEKVVLKLEQMEFELEERNIPIVAAKTSFSTARRGPDDSDFSISARMVSRTCGSVIGRIGPLPLIVEILGNADF
jgi:nucleotidyltransferase/DNA polymerase involved in DNA repair